MNKVILPFLVCTTLTVLSGNTAKAEIVLGGDATFRQAVQACAEEFSTIGGEAKMIWDHLSAPAPTSKRHTIQPPAAPGVFQNSNRSNGAGGNLQPNGNPGAGTGTTTTWDPTDSASYGPPNLGLKRHPCVSLLHELKHAYDKDRGRRNPGIRTAAPPPPPVRSPLTETEVDACGTENRYRQARANQFPPPLGERRFYGPYGLPQSALFQ